MSKKFDIAELERELHACKGAYFETEDIAEVLALVRAVSAAREVADQYELGEVDHRALKRMSAALAPFTDSNDSAEVRSDGE